METIFLIICLLYSTWLGGIATTFLHRLPKKIAINPKAKPRCENCKIELKMIDFFPIFGYLINAGKCKNCKISIPTIFLKLEITIGIIAFLMCIISGNDDINHTIISSILISWTTLVFFIHQQEKKINNTEIIILLILSILYKGYHFIMPNMLGVIITLIFIYKFYEQFKNKLNNESSNIILFTMHISTTTWLLIFPEIIILTINSLITRKIDISPKIILIMHILYFFTIKILSKMTNNFTANEILSCITM